MSEQRSTERKVSSPLPALLKPLSVVLRRSPVAERSFSEATERARRTLDDAPSNRTIGRGQTNLHRPASG
jgi:hypothetical protein